MANKEHVEIIKEGVEDWNKWRRENSNIIRPDLSGAVLSGAKLIKADLRTRHISDFTNSEDPESYDKAFERLLRDLKG